MLRSEMNYTDLMDEKLFATPEGGNVLDLDGRSEFSELDMRDYMELGFKREFRRLGKSLVAYVKKAQEEEFGDTVEAFHAGFTRFVMSLDQSATSSLGYGKDITQYAVNEFRARMFNGLRYQGVRYGTTELYRIIADQLATWDAAAEAQRLADDAARKEKKRAYLKTYGTYTNPKTGKKLVSTVVENLLKDIPTVGTVYCEPRDLRLDTTAQGGQRYDNLQTMFVSVSKEWGADAPALDLDAVVKAFTEAGFLNLSDRKQQEQGYYNLRAKAVSRDFETL